MSYKKSEYISALMWYENIPRSKATKEYRRYKSDKISGINFLDTLVSTHKKGKSEKLLPIYY